MPGKIDELIAKAKLNDLLNRQKEEEENKSVLLIVLAIVGGVIAVAGIAFLVYRCMNGCYKDCDNDFDYDEFEDDFEEEDEDYLTEPDVYVKATK